MEMSISGLERRGSAAQRRTARRAARRGGGPQGFGRVMPRGDEMDALLAGLVHDALGRLAGEEGIVAGGDRVAEVVRSGGRDDADRAHALGAFEEDERLASGQLVDARDELVDGDPV